MRMKLWVKITLYILALYGAVLLEAVSPVLSLVISCALLLPLIVVVALILMF